MTKQRYFTVDEANDLVPALESAFGRIMWLRVQLRKAGADLEKLGEATDHDSLQRTEGPPEAVAARGRARGLLEALTQELNDINDLGVQVKDVDTGLCDFVARREGRDVLLCWKLGEKSVAFWHELTTGFAGRKPIDGSFARTLH
jgi:hypothetical protein